MRLVTIFGSIEIGAFHQLLKVLIQEVGVFGKQVLLHQDPLAVRLLLAKEVWLPVETVVCADLGQVSLLLLKHSLGLSCFDVVAPSNCFSHRSPETPALAPVLLWEGRNCFRTDGVLLGVEKEDWHGIGGGCGGDGDGVGPFPRNVVKQATGAGFQDAPGDGVVGPSEVALDEEVYLGGEASVFAVDAHVITQLQEHTTKEDATGKDIRVSESRSQEASTIESGHNCM